MLYTNFLIVSIEVVDDLKTAEVTPKQGRFDPGILHLILHLSLKLDFCISPWSQYNAK